MKKLIVLMLTFILFFTVFNITPQLKIQIAKADTINVPGDYSTIQAAINHASPGDIIHVFNGIYEETINIDVEGLTLEGQDKENTIIIDSYYLGDVVEVSASNVKIKNFTISYAKENGIIAENINNMTIENCNIENNGAYGVYLLASSNTIFNCEIFENYYSGIKIGGSSYAEANNNAVINCEFYDNGYGGLQDNTMAAVSISPINGIVTNTTITDCLFYSSWSYDIYVEGNTVANNMFYHNNLLSKTVTDNAYDSSVNIWYNQTLEEGNFWIDYTEKYPDATSSNGIWNTPYEISGGNNKDMYPLVDPIGLDRPIADADGPYTANKNVAITFNASGSYDPDGTFLFYEWDLGNGDTRYGETVSYSYSYPGTYTVTLTVEDYHGLTDSDTTTAVITGSPNNPPNVPSDPIPSNGSVDVDLDTDISWSCSDPDGDDLTYNVYFGTTDSPPKVSSNQSGTTYDPGIMNFNTKYYWKIVAWDNHSESTIGSIWDFTTKVNNPPNLPRNPDPSNHNTSVDIDAELIWLGGDPDSGDTVTYDVYFGTASSPPKVKSNQSSTTYDPDIMNFNTNYYWKIVAWDNHGLSTSGPNWDFTTTDYVNYPPNIPYNPTPKNGTTNVNINQDLYWNGGDLNSNDTVTYDIYFGTASPPVKIVSNQSATSYDPGTMNYNTKYYWKIIANDNHEASSTGPIWSFTIQQKSSGGGGGGGGDFIPPNTVPIANASASENSGLVNKAIKFDGSYSVDEDGEITNYTWDFGDSSFGYGVITTHIYKKTGTYTVKLTVTDDNDVSDTDTLRVIISEPNNPPSIPQIEGPKTGKQNIEYNFTVYSTDPDNDNIQYVFNWGDEQTNETDFVANGTIYTEKHKWTSPGIYKIKIYAIDSNYAVSTSAETNILIDIFYCKNIGYFIDEDSDGIYDLFYSNQTGIKTVTERLENGSYLINSDIDSDWDYIYNTQTAVLSAYSPETAPGETEVDNTIFYVLAIVVIIIILLLFAMLGKKPKEEKKIEKEEEEKPEKETTKKKQTKTQKKKSTTKKKGKKRK